MNLLVFFGLVFKASLFSTNGMGNVPILHDDLLPRGWASEKQFAEALAVGQVSPGPNGLWVISLGYLLGGGQGALLCLLAICLPPLLVLFIDRVYQKIQHLPAVQGFMHGLSLAVVGIFAVVLLGLLRVSGLSLQSLSFLAASLVLGATRRLPIVVVIALAALVGAALR